MLDGSSILVVDDEKVIREILGSLLTREGCHVQLASNGESGLELAKTESFDAVLLDVMMPGMNGFGVWRRIKQNPKTTHIPVIMITALSGHYNLVRGLEARADESLYEAKKTGRNPVVSQASLTSTKAAKFTKASKPTKKAKTA